MWNAWLRHWCIYAPTSWNTCPTWSLFGTVEVTVWTEISITQLEYPLAWFHHYYCYVTMCLWLSTLPLCYLLYMSTISYLRLLVSLCLSISSIFSSLQAVTVGVLVCPTYHVKLRVVSSMKYLSHNPSKGICYCGSKLAFSCKHRFRLGQQQRHSQIYGPVHSKILV